MKSIFAFLGVVILATSCFSQEADETTGVREPPAKPTKPELVFSDDFSLDTRNDYSINGDVAWESGVLKLSEGATITREIRGGPRVALEIHLQAPELPDEGQESALKIWFDLDGGVMDCYVQLFQHRSNGEISSEICLFDTGGQFGEQQPAKLVKRMSLNGPLNGHWKLKYRHGLVSVTSAKDDVFKAFVKNRGASVTRSIVECGKQGWAIDKITVFRFPIAVRKYDTEEYQKLLDARQIDTRLATLTREGKYEDATKLAEEVQKIRKSVLGEHHLEYSDSLNNLAVSYLHVGDDARAVPLIKQSINIKKFVLGEGHPAYADSLSNLAMLRGIMGDYTRAKLLCEQAMKIRKSALGEGHPDYAASLNNLAVWSQEMGDYTRAEPLLKQAMEIRKSTLGEGHPDYATSLNNLANLYKNMDDYTHAEPLYKQARDIWKSALGEAHPKYAGCLHDLALLYVRMGDDARGESLLKQAMEITKSVLGEDHPMYAACLNSLAIFYLGMGDYARPEPLHRQAFGIVRQRLELNSLVQSERQQKRNQSRNRVYFDSWLATSFCANRFTNEVLETVWQWKGAVTFRQRAYRAVSANPKLAPLFESLQSASRQLSVASGQKPIPPMASANQEKHDNYKRNRELWEERFAKLNREREDLEQQIAAKSQEFRDLQESLTVEAVQELLPAEAAFVDFLEYNHPTPNPDKHGHINSERRYVAFVVTKDHEPALIGLGSAISLNNAIEVFRRPFDRSQNTARNRAAAMKAGRQLRDQLWLPLEKHLAGIETIIISPDTDLGTMPWAALPGRKTNTFLLEDYKLASVPFANLLPGLTRQQPSTSNNRGLLVLGDVDYDADPKPHIAVTTTKRPTRDYELGQWRRSRGDTAGRWTSLSGFRKELETVKSLYQQRFGSDAPLSTLSGIEATESSFCELASRYGTLHLITHGYFENPDVKSIDQAEISHDEFSSQSNGPDPFINTWRPGLLSGLVLAGANRKTDDPQDLDDGLLLASEIEAESLQGVDLVVLSACETGLGAVAGGEGLTGLRRAFHIAGARSVVASLWKVEDRATQELMRRFYENLWINKLPKIDALREAQLWMLRHPQELEAMGINNAQRRGKPRDLLPEATESVTNGKTDPYFWATFQLSGDWR